MSYVNGILQRNESGVPPHLYIVGVHWSSKPAILLFHFHKWNWKVCDSTLKIIYIPFGILNPSALWNGIGAGIPWRYLSLL